MKLLPGNDFAKRFETFEGGLEADAILALAFEQRTANLIAYAALMWRTSDHGAMSALEDQVESRLDLSDKED